MSCAQPRASGVIKSASVIICQEQTRSIRVTLLNEIWDARFAKDLVFLFSSSRNNTEWPDVALLNNVSVARKALPFIFSHCRKLGAVKLP